MSDSSGLPVNIFSHPSSLDHDTGAGHPESPERLRAVLAALGRPDVSRPITWCEAPAAEPAAIARVHTRVHLDALHRLRDAGGGSIDADTRVGDRSVVAAVHAAGAAVSAARSALTGTPAFAAVRPPGHHATANRAMGFCLLNNIAIAAYAAIAEVDLERVLIIDWDVHHGNGTQAIVEREPRIRYVSLHQWPLYPGTGRADDRGVGNVFNVPRPEGLARSRYVADLNAGVSRATDGWTPQLVLISAGFDALAGDPLAGFTLEPADYAGWVRGWRELGAPLASVLEGGYVPARVAAGAVAHVEAM